MANVNGVNLRPILDWYAKATGDFGDDFLNDGGWDELDGIAAELGDALDVRENDDAVPLLTALTPAEARVISERRRHVSGEGWTAARDDKYKVGELALAAATYAAHAAFTLQPVSALADLISKLWPWAWGWWKPKTVRRDLERAGALIIAELERLDRVQDAAPPART